MLNIGDGERGIFFIISLLGFRLIQAWRLSTCLGLFYWLFFGHLNFQLTELKGLKDWLFLRLGAVKLTNPNPAFFPPNKTIAKNIRHPNERLKVRFLGPATKPDQAESTQTSREQGSGGRFRDDVYLQPDGISGFGVATGLKLNHIACVIGSGV